MHHVSELMEQSFDLENKNSKVMNVVCLPQSLTCLCSIREGVVALGRGKLHTMAATAAWRLPCLSRLPDCRSHMAA